MFGLCVSSSGIAPIGPNCLEDGHHQCATCTQGFVVVKKKCKPVCYCPGGKPDNNKDGWCENVEEPSVKCKPKGCLLGFYSDPVTGTCVAQQCVCHNGPALTGPECPEDGAIGCADCNKGYHRMGLNCFINTCQCNRGIPAMGIACPKNGAYNCACCGNAVTKSSSTLEVACIKGKTLDSWHPESRVKGQES